MNYRHSYHAGNFSEVFKHSLLLGLLKNLSKKEAGFLYLDTHAGSALYDLQSEESIKSPEYLGGISLFYEKDSSSFHPWLKEYLQYVRQLNNNQGLIRYPGSPLIAQHAMRQQDRAALCELHPEEAARLKKIIKDDKRFAIHHMDGFQSLKAFLPPKEKRGFVLIDPPYEKTNEREMICDALKQGLQKWPQGTYAIWYPLTSNHPEELILLNFAETLSQPFINIDLKVFPQTHKGLIGCGMLIINPPWLYEEEAKVVTSEIKEILLAHSR